MAIANLTGLGWDIAPRAVDAASITLETAAGADGGTFTAAKAGSIALSSDTLTVGTSLVVAPTISLSGTKGLGRVYDDLYFPPDLSGQTIIPGDQNVPNGNTTLATFPGLAPGTSYRLEAWCTCGYTVPGQTTTWQVASDLAASLSGWRESYIITDNNAVSSGGPMIGWPGIQTFGYAAPPVGNFQGATQVAGVPTPLNMNKLVATFFITGAVTSTLSVQLVVVTGIAFPVSNMVITLTPFT